MYQINGIGKVKFHKEQVTIIIHEDYRKGLLHADSFSHMHLVYGSLALENEDSKWS